jgi:hypothetical protein
MPICKLCRSEATLVDAHIIPESFFRAINRGDGPLQIVSNDPSMHPKRAPVGVYDQNLVCRRCEDRFSPWDSYAADLLINRRDSEFAPFLTAEGLIPPATRASNVDYRNLRLFVLSLLWRAAASSHRYFSRIEISAQVNRLRELVLAADVGNQSEFGTVFCRWVDDRSVLAGQFMVNPYEYDSTRGGARMVRFLLGSFILDIQVDDTPLPEFLASVALAPNRPLYVIHRKLIGSKDLDALEPAFRNVAARAQKKRDQ